jgi:hypothetical protein
MPPPRENLSLFDHTAPGTYPHLEITDDIDLDRARDHVLPGTMHGRGAKSFFEGMNSASGKLGGGDVSGGNKEMKRTGNRDLDRAREHVLGGRR